MNEERKKNRVGLWVLFALVLIGALGFGVLQWALQLREEGAPSRPSVNVPAEFRQARESEGHRAHFGAELRCVDCHEEGVDQEVEKEVRPGACSECHEGHEPEALASIDHLHGALEGEDAPRCVTCHDFRNVDPHPRDDCQRCHVGEEATSTTVSLHIEESCDSCHRPHEDPATTSEGCLGCHEERTSGHGASEESEAARCLGCHDMHQPGLPAAERCEGCHAEEEPRVRTAFTFFRGHEDCTTCHSDHDFTRSSVIRCQQCHQNMPTMGASEAPAHANCQSCHSPHAPIRSPKRRCVACHEEVHSDHPAPADSCTSCHDIHPARHRGRAAPATAATCTSCHEEAAREDALHAGGVRCGDCHRPHDFVLEGGPTAQCSSCHAEQLNAVAALSGHANCADCHGESSHHRPNAEPAACAGCHAEQHQSAPEGHRECGACHDSHGGALIESATSCAGCHEVQAAAPHGADQLSCESCHRAHGPGGVAPPPRCSSCHTVGGLPNMHGITEHRQRCLDCHQPHGPSGTREACTGCHEDMQEHIPETDVCTGCHAFRGPGVETHLPTP